MSNLGIRCIAAAGAVLLCVSGPAHTATAVLGDDAPPSERGTEAAPAAVPDNAGARGGAAPADKSARDARPDSAPDADADARELVRKRMALCRQRPEMCEQKGEPRDDSQLRQPGGPAKD
jgi:hypothetical protein